MKQLTLLRHAKSSWKDPTLVDADRPLNDRGERDAPAMGARLAARKLRPSLIVSSHAVRALTTARTVAQALGYPQEFLQIEKELYLASPEEILDVLAQQDDNFNNLLAVGHNPGFTDLANRLLPDLRLDNLPTGGVVAVSLPISRWADIKQASGSLDFYDYPKNTEPLVVEH